MRANRGRPTQSIGPEDVDTLFSETDTGRLFSLWNSEAELADLTAASDGELSARRRLRPGRAHQRGDPRPRTGSPSFTIRQGSHNIEIEGRVASLRLQHIVVGTGRAFGGGQYVRDTVNGQQYKLIYSVINLSSGELIRRTSSSVKTARLRTETRGTQAI